MLFVLHIIQIVIAVLLIGTIILQQRGGGLSATFGGEGGVYHTRRGVEKIIFQATIVLAGIFFAAAIANIVLEQQEAGSMTGKGAATSTALGATSSVPSSAPEGVNATDPPLEPSIPKSSSTGAR